MPIILNINSKIEQAKAIELLISTVQKDEITKVIMSAFYGKSSYFSDEKLVAPENYLDDWLKNVIAFSESQEAGNIMNNMQKVFVLRGTELFKQLSGEILLIIAGEAGIKEMVAGEMIFAEGDPPTGLYIVASGSVEIRKQDKVLNTLDENAFFGELALIDDTERAASAIAKSDGVLLFLEKETFNRITDDQPEVLRAVLRVVLFYLRQSFLKTPAREI
jgi:CRP-like cAMP-binding protein